MSVRIDFFHIEGTIDFEVVPAADLEAAIASFDTGSSVASGAVRCIGWLSASDADEDDLGAWSEAVDEHLGIGLLHQGLGEDHDLPTAVADEADEPRRSWASTVSAALRAVDGGRLGWRTSFDDPGTVDSDPEHDTAAHPLD